VLSISRRPPSAAVTFSSPALPSASSVDAWSHPAAAAASTTSTTTSLPLLYHTWHQDRLSFSGNNQVRYLNKPIGWDWEQATIIGRKSDRRTWWITDQGDSQHPTATLRRHELSVSQGAFLLFHICADLLTAATSVVTPSTESSVQKKATVVAETSLIYRKIISVVLVLIVHS